MVTSQSYTLNIQYKKYETAILNCSFGSDGSFYLVDLVSNHSSEHAYEIMTFNSPVNKVGMEKIIKIDKKRYYSKNKLKFSHHASGFFQVSGEKPGTVISGVDKETGAPKGASVQAFKLKIDTNDGGPFLTGHFWGLNSLPSRKSKTSAKICFSDDEINYQSMNNKGIKPSFALLFFHLPINKLSEEEQKKDWIYYDYKHYKKPLLLRLIKGEKSFGYMVGISCLKCRCNSNYDFGYILSGGAGEIDKTTGTCKNIAIVFPSEGNNADIENCITLDRI